MKKIIPFKHDIPFKTNLYEITGISLEHSLKHTKNSVYGELIVSGEYKINYNSTSVENFQYTMPFSIDFTDEYNLDKSTIEIDDFYYEIVNNDTLSVSIDVLIDNIEEILIPKLEEKNIERYDIFKEEKLVDEKKERCIEEENPKIDNIFNTMDFEDEKYSIYSVYIVRENDNIENILSKYNITKEELEEYNDLSNMKLGMKLIIPSKNEEV